MTGKQFELWDKYNHNESVRCIEDGAIYSTEIFVELYNQLAEENQQLKKIINETFNVIVESDFAKNLYCNALLEILGDENDVDKAKNRIKEFLK